MTDRKQAAAKRRRPRREPVDPRDVIEQIAADPDASPALRYRAASRVLAIQEREARQPKPAVPAGNGAAHAVDEPLDAVTLRALEIAAARNNGRLN